ncbi:hypothetical protein BC941DRAFT_457814 [Chlamydoabsidia padenii]|nr:hypothetical protein BC941DRAFT_457814 [Chlamydoabsidia padenii]
MVADYVFMYPVCPHNLMSLSKKKSQLPIVKKASGEKVNQDKVHVIHQKDNSKMGVIKTFYRCGWLHPNEPGPFLLNNHKFVVDLIGATYASLIFFCFVVGIMSYCIQQHVRSVVLPILVVFNVDGFVGTPFCDKTFTIGQGPYYTYECHIWAKEVFFYNLDSITNHLILWWLLLASLLKNSDTCWL